MASKRREKEFDREISDSKKHRKTIATSSNDIQEVKMNIIEDVYAVSIYDNINIKFMS